jgi:hypothetical protein
MLGVAGSSLQELMPSKSAAVANIAKILDFIIIIIYYKE